MAAGLAVLMFLATGCGDGDAGSAATTATPERPDLRGHMLVEGDLDGAALPRPALIKDPEEWVVPSGHENADQVRASGFVEGMRAESAEAVNLTARFKTHQQALAEAAFSPPIKGIEITDFAVPGVPGVIGHKTTGEGHGTGYNIAFVTGDVFHLIAAKAGPVSRAQMITATQRLYERVTAAG